MVCETFWVDWYADRTDGSVLRHCVLFWPVVLVSQCIFSFVVSEAPYSYTMPDILILVVCSSV